MNTTPTTLWLLLVSLTAGLVMFGCEPEPAKQKTDETTTKALQPRTDGKKVPLGKRNVFLEVFPDKTKRVLVNASVCRRMDLLEHLMCRKGTKEHEAILAADVDARDIHMALLAAGAEQGHPVKFQPKFMTPTGSKIRILLQYEKKGDKDKKSETVVVPAQQWIRNIKTQKPMEQTHWVFAGSMFIPDPMDATRPPFYAANDGDLITVVNFEFSVLDLPVELSKDNQDLMFEANTEVIPPLETPVLVILEPISETKKDNSKK